MDARETAIRFAAQMLEVEAPVAGAEPSAGSYVAELRRLAPLVSAGELSEEEMKRELAARFPYLAPGQ